MGLVYGIGYIVTVEMNMNSNTDELMDFIRAYWKYRSEYYKLFPELNPWVVKE